MELNRAALLRATLPSLPQHQHTPSSNPSETATKQGLPKPLLHPSLHNALLPPAAVARAQLTTTFGNASDPDLLVPSSARDTESRHTTRTAQSWRQPSPATSPVALSTGRSSQHSRQSRSRARLAPIPRSLGLATQWSDAPDVAGATEGVGERRRRVAFARSLPALPAVTEQQQQLQKQLQQSEESERRMRAMFAAAEARSERTWRTALRPGRGGRLERWGAGHDGRPRGSTSSLPSRDGGLADTHRSWGPHFVAKAQLPPGQWERECAVSSDPASQAIFGRTTTTTGGPASSGGHRGGDGLLTAAKLRGLERARRGKERLDVIQRRADRAAELVGLRAEARSVAKARQRLRYAKANLGIGIGGGGDE